MKRSGFKRPQLERKRTVHTPAPAGLSARVIMARCDEAAEPVHKENPVRHEGYRRLVAQLPCIACGKVGRSQHAHENEGKGKGLKVDDRRAMPLCADEPGQEGCHTKFDQYRLLPGGHDAHDEQGRTWSAQTRAEIEAAGLWPKNLPRIA
jgi:hypothetical protein